MSGFSNATIEAIKDRLDLVEMVQRYVDLRQAGGNWVGVCPFHQESKPSFSVNPGKGFYYCFGCQASGDVIDFYCRINGLNFSQGIQELGKEAGVDLGSYDPSKNRQKEDLRRAALEMHKLAQDFFQKNLSAAQGQAARNYVRERGFSDEMIRMFALGWSGSGWQDLKNHLGRHGFKPEQGVEAGLLSKSTQGRIFDRFRSRLTFPIFDLSGKVVAFGGRIVGPGEPKYLNSSDSPVFKKGNLLYGLYQARKSITQNKEAILTEGYADVLSLVQYGFTNACGVLGTALTQHQSQRLSGLCKVVYLIFDGDRAGRQAAFRSTEMLLQHGLQVRVVNLPQEEDVDSFLGKYGSRALEGLFREAQDGLAFCQNMLNAASSPKEITGWAVSFLQNLQDSSFRAYFLPRIARGFGLSETELRQALQARGHKAQRNVSEEGHKGMPLSGRDREMLHFAVCCPEYVQDLNSLGIERALASEKGRSFWRKLLQFGGNDESFLRQLDEEEKNFYIGCSFAGKYSANKDAVFQDICAFLKKKQQEQKQKSIRQALIKAQQEGDSQRIDALLHEYSNILRGSK